MIEDWRVELSQAQLRALWTKVCGCEDCPVEKGDHWEVYSDGRIYKVEGDEKARLTYELDPDKIHSAIKELFPGISFYHSEY